MVWPSTTRSCLSNSGIILYPRAASAALNIQIIVATQSVLMVNCFEPEDIVIVERPGRASTFRRLDSEDLCEWLSDYSLAELWEKNVLGGRP